MAEYTPISVRTLIREHETLRSSKDPDRTKKAGWTKDRYQPENFKEKLDEMIGILKTIEDDFILDGFYATFKSNAPDDDSEEKTKTYDIITLHPFEENPQSPLGLYIKIDSEAKEYKYSIHTERNNWKPEAMISYESTLTNWLNMWKWYTKNDRFRPK